MTVLCNQPEAFASDLGDDQPRYFLSNGGTEIVQMWGVSLSPTEWNGVGMIIKPFTADPVKALHFAIVV